MDCSERLISTRHTVTNYMDEGWIPDEKWRTIAQNVPIPSVDLVVECPDGVVLAKRSNQPAEEEWFVPGGRVQKGERLSESVRRVARTELGADVTVREALGTFEHFYQHLDVGEKTLHCTRISCVDRLNSCRPIWSRYRWCLS